jgi:hypothetical protein
MPNPQPPIVPNYPPYPPPLPGSSPRWWSELKPLPKALVVLGAAFLGVCLIPAMVIAAIGGGAHRDEASPASPTRAAVVAPPAPAMTTSTPIVAPPPTTPPPTTPPPTRASTTAAAPHTTTKSTTKPAPKPTAQCDPNYAWACVPIASDVDCAGGSGNGPAYVQGPVKVIGTDIYDLDRDGDGIGCEN